MAGPGQRRDGSACAEASPTVGFVGPDDEDRSGVFVQDFVPGRDTSATRRKVAGFSSEYLTESLGVSTDGKHLTIATLHQTSGLALAEGLTGVGPPRAATRR